MKLTTKNMAKTKSLLTKEAAKYFKLLFDYGMEDDYKLSSINTLENPNRHRPFTMKEKVILYSALCNFIEKATNMTYTQVEEVYGRKRDENDKALDMLYANEEFPIDHYRLSNENNVGGIARIHGYMRNGVFVVRRVDWTHRFHKKKR